MVARYNALVEKLYAHATMNAAKSLGLFWKGLEPFKRVWEPFAQGLETAFIPSKTTKLPTIVAFLMEYCVTIDASR